MKGSDTRGAQGGFTLTEALVAFAITATGFLAVATVQGDLMFESGYNRARAEALALAEEKLEQFAHYTHADETNFIDDNQDGIMDPDGTYTEAPITGQNAVFTRSWDLVTGEQAKEIDVTVAWPDASGRVQSVSLGGSVSWISPRAGADQLIEPETPIIQSPLGNAEYLEGDLSNYPNAVLVSRPGDDGLSTYRNDENLLLVDSRNNVLLMLRDACDVTTGLCSDFVRISGRLYLDTANTSQKLTDTYVVTSDSGHCQRWVTSGTLTNPPTTPTRDYKYYEYTCYLGRGWRGNIGILTAPGRLQQTDKVCQGDPTSLNSWEEPVIALRRVYRGMLHRTVNGQTLYYSHGIRDAARLNGHHFVFTSLDASSTLGSFCEGYDAPMTRTDSNNGALFAGVPTDFFCLNQDIDGDGAPDYLDSYDPTIYGASAGCPYDPTDPPVLVNQISGQVLVRTSTVLDLSAFQVVTSDGAGNCTWTSAFVRATNGYAASYSCNVYDWGTGWNGYIQIQPNTTSLYCPDDTVDFSSVTSDQYHDFDCTQANTVTIQGALAVQSTADSISSIFISDVGLTTTGYCRVTDTDYRCQLPYSGLNVDILLTVGTADFVCGSVAGEFTFGAYTSAGSPYTQDIVVIANGGGSCP